LTAACCRGTKAGSLSREVEKMKKAVYVKPKVVGTSSVHPC